MTDATSTLKMKKTNTTSLERMLIIDFLSDSQNFAIITGSAAKGKPMRSGQRLTKAHGFQLMAEHVNKGLLTYTNLLNKVVNVQMGQDGQLSHGLDEDTSVLKYLDRIRV
ncbi:hypothetical protein AC1031_004281 [Aphanomyces cochlioides]|nr:hypothetical protein AC1031_004281 [Aphanomyces cochlioides]